MRIRDIGKESDNRIPGEFREVENRLRDEKPALTALELDAIKLQALSSAKRRSPGPIARKKGTFMKSRLAVVLVLTLGVFMSGTGATLAVSGTSSSGSASSAQYPEPAEEHSIECVEGTSGTGAAGTEGSETGAQSGGENCETQEVRQVATSGGDSGGSLPFTGFLAVPVLIIGLGLLGAGVAMRLRMRSDDHGAY